MNKFKFLHLFSMLYCICINQFVFGQRSKFLERFKLNQQSSNNSLVFACGNISIENKIFNNKTEIPRCHPDICSGYFGKHIVNIIRFHITTSVPYYKCRFPEIPENFKFDQFPSLVTLDLSDVQLETLEMNALRNAESIKTLIVSDNRLTDISPKFFPSTEQIEELDLSKNAIQRIDPLAFKTAKSIKKIKLSNNKISEIVANCFSVPSLVELDISHNTLQSVDEHAFKGAINLYVLDLSYNFIFSLKAGTFSDMVKLGYLKLKGAGILSIESGTFSQQPKLHNLDLSENRLVNLDFSQVKLPNVDHIDLSRNNLIELRGFQHAVTPKLLQMNLLGNDFNCSYLINLMGVRWRVFVPSYPPENRGKPHVNGVLCKITPINEGDNEENEPKPTIPPTKPTNPPTKASNPPTKPTNPANPTRTPTSPTEPSTSLTKPPTNPTKPTFNGTNENESHNLDYGPAIQQLVNELKSDASFVKYALITIFVCIILFVCIKSCSYRNGRLIIGRHRQETDFPTNKSPPAQIVTDSITEKD